MRFTRLAVFLLALIATPATDMEFGQRVKAFDDAYMPFLSTLCGWPDGQPEVNAKGEAICMLAKGHLDHASYAKARRAAMKLFDLVEKTK